MRSARPGPPSISKRRATPDLRRGRASTPCRGDAISRPSSARVVATVPAISIVDGLKAYRGRARATQLIVGKSQRSRLVRTAPRIGRRPAGARNAGRRRPCLAARRDAAAQPSRLRIPRGPWGSRRGYLWTAADGRGGHRGSASALFHILDLRQCRSALSAAGHGGRDIVRPAHRAVRGARLQPRL